MGKQQHLPAARSFLALKLWRLQRPRNVHLDELCTKDTPQMLSIPDSNPISSTWPPLRSFPDRPGEETSSPVLPDAWRCRCLSRSFHVYGRTLLDNWVPATPQPALHWRWFNQPGGRHVLVPMLSSKHHLPPRTVLLLFLSSFLPFINIHPSAAHHLNHHQRPTTITFIGRHSFLAFLNRV